MRHKKKNKTIFFINLRKQEILRIIPQAFLFQPCCFTVLAQESAVAFYGVFHRIF